LFTLEIKDYAERIFLSAWRWKWAYKVLICLALLAARLVVLNASWTRLTSLKGKMCGTSRLTMRLKLQLTPRQLQL
jgi:hypothetical protein